MSIVTILVALAVAFIAWKILSGLIKFATIAIVVVGTLWFLSTGGFGA